MTTTTTAKLEPAKLDAFMNQFLADNAAAIRGGLNYIGDRLGIYKALSVSGPVTVDQLAQKTGLKKRYLQEWLSAQVTGRYVEYDPANKTFFLPPEHAALLCDESSAMYAGGLLQMVLPLVTMAPEVAKAFQNGGGVAHDDHHPEMTEAIERFTRPFFTHFLTQAWIPSMPEAHNALKAGCKAADIGCGAGQAAIALAKAYPNSQIFGFDDHAPSIERARLNAQQEGVADRITFAVADATKSAADGEFQFISTFDVIHDMVDPLAGLKSIKRLLAKDGTYLMLEMNVADNLEENINHFGSLCYSISTLYCMTVSLAGDGAGIGACMGESRARHLVQQAGFKHFRRLPASHPLSVLYEVKH
jgi:SAM-dependent methyltransferase